MSAGIDKRNALPFPARPRATDALIPEGRYQARFLDYKTAYLFHGRAPKVLVYFQIMTFGPSFETVLPAYYVVRGLRGKAKRRGRFDVGLKSRLARDLAAMLERRPPLTYIPAEDVQTRFYWVEVRTVATDSLQNEIPTGARYSVVDRVVGCAE